MKPLFSTSRIAGLALVALPVLALTTPTGCKSDDEPQGGLVIGTDTRMQVPKDIDYVSVSVYSNGALRFERLAKIKPDGTLDLPATLAIIQPEDGNTSVRLRLMAFGGNKPRVLHDFITSVPRAGRIAYLDLPLDFLDDGSGEGDLKPFVDPTLPQPFDATKFKPALCSQDFHDTALDGECQDNRIDPSLLPEYRDDLVGSPASCFDVAACLAAAKPVPIDMTGLDLSDCSVSAAGRDVTKLNLAFATPSTGLCLAPGKCFVPLVNGTHGWKQDGARLKLPRGACTKYLSHPEKSVTLYDVTGCAPMTSSTTICRASAIADGGTDGGDASLPPATGTPTDRLLLVDMPYSLREVGDDGSTLNYRFVSPDGVGGVVHQNGGELTVTPVKPKPFPGAILRTSAVVTGAACRPFVTSDREPWSFDGTSYAPVAPFVTGPERVLMAACDFTAQGWLTTEALWTVSGFALSFNPNALPTKAPIPPGGFGEPSAMMLFSGDTLIGNRAGELFLCTGVGPDCSKKQTLSTAPGPHEILDIVLTSTLDPGGNAVNLVYILATDGVYAERFPGTSIFNDFGPPPQLIAPGDFSRPADANVQQSFQLFPNSRCGFFVSKQGLEWVNPDTLARGFVATATFGTSPGKYRITSIVGDGANVGHLLWTLTAPAAEGGGIYRSEIPIECGRDPMHPSGLRSQCVVYGKCGDSGNAGCCSGVCNPNGTCRP